MIDCPLMNIHYGYLPLYGYPFYKRLLQGLCGTYNGRENDDYLTREGDIEEDPTNFANK